MVEINYITVISLNLLSFFYRMTFDVNPDIREKSS